jgi:hypothetical protein
MTFCDGFLESSDRVSPGDAAPGASAILQLLAELEGSLQVGQKALLNGDLAVMERSTCEQARLQHGLADLVMRDSVNRGAKSVHDAQARVLHLGRVQAALLVRAQLRLRIIANLLAGAEGNDRSPVYAEAAAVRVAHGA